MANRISPRLSRRSTAVSRKRAAWVAEKVATMLYTESPPAPAAEKLADALAGRTLASRESRQVLFLTVRPELSAALRPPVLFDLDPEALAQRARLTLALVAPDAEDAFAELQRKAEIEVLS